MEITIPNRSRQFQKTIKTKNTVEKTISLRQFTITHVLGFNGYCQWHWLWDGWSHTLFSRFCTVWLSPVPQHKKNNRRIKSIALIMTSYRLLLVIFSNRMKASSLTWSKQCNTYGRNAWTTRRNMLSKIHLGSRPSNIFSFRLFYHIHNYSCTGCLSSPKLTLNCRPL